LEYDLIESVEVIPIESNMSNQPQSTTRLSAGHDGLVFFSFFVNILVFFWSRNGSTVPRWLVAVAALPVDGYTIAAIWAQS
jgi:hypothetical protein